MPSHARAKATRQGTRAVPAVLPAALNEIRQALLPDDKDFPERDKLSERICRHWWPRLGDEGLRRALWIVKNAQQHRVMARRFRYIQALHSRLPKWAASILQDAERALDSLAFAASVTERQGNRRDRTLVVLAETTLAVLQEPRALTGLHLCAAGLGAMGRPLPKAARRGKPHECYISEHRRELGALLAHEERKGITHTEQREITRLLQAHGVIGLRKKTFEDLGIADRLPAWARR